MKNLPFKYGFAGKARWKTNRVFLIAFGIAFFYVNIGRMRVCVAVAELVPVIYKWFVGLALFTLFWFTERRIHKRLCNPTSMGPLPLIWKMSLLLLAVIFGMVTADKRIIFTVVTSFLVLFLCLSDRIFRQERKDRSIR